MSIFLSIERIANDYAVARARYRTERAIRALPHELQKDIGWPESADIHLNQETRGIGSWAGGK